MAARPTQGDGMGLSGMGPPLDNSRDVAAADRRPCPRPPLPRGVHHSTAPRAPRLPTPMNLHELHQSARIGTCWCSRQAHTGLPAGRRRTVCSHTVRILLEAFRSRHPDQVCPVLSRAARRGGIRDRRVSVRRRACRSRKQRARPRDTRRFPAAPRCRHC